MNITTQQLAELLIGIARTQQAVIEAVESAKPGFKGTHLAPALDSVAKIRSTGRPLSLQEYPARVLLQCQGRAGPNVEQIARDLELILSGEMPSPSLVAPATVRAAEAASRRAAASAVPATPQGAATAAPANVADNDLDMTK